MVNHDDYNRLCAIATEQWREMEAARRAGQWRTYWAIRQQWIATGRLISSMYLDLQEEKSAQLSMLAPRAGLGHHVDVG